MTIKELKEYIKHLPDDCIVKFEYSGPDASAEIVADGFIINEEKSEILLTSTDW